MYYYYRSVDLRCYLQWLHPEFCGSWPLIERMPPPRLSILYNDGDTAARSWFVTGEAGDRASCQPESLGFYFQVFLVPKKNGKLQRVINCWPLNQCILCPHFWMETVASISSAVQPGDWAMSLDLTDAYFHVPIAPWFWKYLHFVVNGQVWQFRALPFGLLTAPWVCTRLLSPLSIHLHACGVLFHCYLDNLFIRAPRSLCRSWTHTLLSLLYRLWLGVNREKLEANPSQDFVYVEVCFQTTKEISLPPSDHLQSACRIIHTLLHRRSAPAQFWLSLLGTLGSLEKLVPLGHLHIYPIHFCLRHQFLLGVHPLTWLVSLNREASGALCWWLQARNMETGVLLGPFHPHLMLFTDSSLYCWGAHSVNLQVSGVWSDQEKCLLINTLELLSSRHSRQTAPFWQGKQVFVASDNTTTVVYINHQGERNLWRSWTWHSSCY